MTVEQPPTAAWTELDTARFIESGDVFVPDRERQVQIVAERVVAAEGSVRRVLDLCCGEGQLTAALLRGAPEATVHACDASETMLARARERAGGNAHRLSTRRFRLEDEDWRSVEEPFDAVVSSLAIHHLDGPGKRRLFADIARMLRPGGVLVVADLVEPAAAFGKRLWARQWEEEVERRSQERLGTRDGLARFRQLGWNYYALPGPDPLDKPSTLVEQLDWLRESGFRAVDVHWLVAGHAVFSGVRG